MTSENTPGELNNEPVLTQQTHLLQVIEGHDGGTAGMVHDLEGRLFAIRQDDLVDGHADDPTLIVRGAVESAHCA
jgi:hypothetical protein